MSVYSALRKGQSPDPVRKRLKITLIVAGVAALIGYILGALSDPKGIGEVLALGTILAAVFAIPAAIVAFLIQYLFRRDYRCDYVGTDGIADYDLLDLRRGKPGSILRFADATDMNITLTPQRIKGIRVPVWLGGCEWQGDIRHLRRVLYRAEVSRGQIPLCQCGGSGLVTIPTEAIKVSQCPRIEYWQASDMASR